MKMSRKETKRNRPPDGGREGVQGVFKRPEWMTDREWKNEKIRLTFQAVQTVICVALLALAVAALIK